MATLARGARLREFVVEKVIGVGGFGIVYLASDPALGRRVAIKEYMPSTVAMRADDGMSVISRSVDSTETFTAGLRSFVNEARLLVRFDHPALVKVHQFWESNGTGYMVMPFYEGPTLRQALSTLGRLPTEEEICAWLMPLLDALELLHTDNCLHRDIAPDNILLTEHGPLLLDFGAARRVIGDLTHALTAVLKPGFAPVEQYGDSPDLKQGPWTDLFALASVIYLAASGERPTPSVDRIVVDRLPPLARLAEGMFGEPFLKAVDHALAVLPVHRPQSVAEFRAMLQGRIAVPAVGAATTPLSQAAPGRMPHNLPRQRTSFVGREAEVADLKGLLETAPLVTVLGMGGMGKTRLTLQVAHELLPRFADGAWFVDLSSVTEPALVTAAAARALDLLEEPGRPLVETVCAWLRPRRALLVLDNCEQVLEAAGDFVHAVLSQAPQAAVLASSRELLDVPGEQAYPIRPLPLPARDVGHQSVLQSAAVRMFLDRARAQQPDFEAGIDDATALAELVHRLEGIPLAIELAAARLKTLLVPEILAGLDDRYALLAGGSRQLQRRQQTMRALVDWSYDMLAPGEQRIFARLAVFAGRFDEAAALAVCAEGDDSAALVAQALSSLVQKSLLVREGEGEGATQRLRMLETLRDYAREKLATLDAAGAAAGRHCTHYFAFAKQAGRGIQGREQGRWVEQLDAQIDNLRAAVACALGGGADPLVAVKLAVALTGFWILRGHCGEGRRLVDAALALPAVRQSALGEAWALYTGAALASSQGDHEAASAMLERCLALRRAQGQPVDIAATLSTLALARLQAGDPEAAEAHEFEALGLFDSIDDRRGQAIGWLHLGQVHAWTGEGPAALADLERAVDLAREIGNHEIEAECELTAAEVHWRAGDADAAEGAAQRSLDICQATGDRRGEAAATWWLGRIGLLAGRTGMALPLLQRALPELKRHDMRPQLLGCLEDVVHAWLDQGQAARGVELAAAIDQARQRLKLGRAPVDAPRWSSLVAALRSALDAEQAEAAARTGRAWETDDAVRAALAGDDGPTRPA